MSDESIDRLLLLEFAKVSEKCDKINEKVQMLNGQFAAHEELFRKHLETDERMYEEFHEMNLILRDNTESLKEHMRRTTQIETAILKIDDRLQPIEQERLRKQAIQDFFKERGKMWAMRIGVVSAIIGALIKVISIL